MELTTDEELEGPGQHTRTHTRQSGAPREDPGPQNSCLGQGTTASYRPYSKQIHLLFPKNHFRSFPGEHSKLGHEFYLCPKSFWEAGRRQGWHHK